MTQKSRRVSDAGLSDDPVYFKVLTEIDMIAHMAANEFEKLLPPGLTQAQFGVLNRLMRLGRAETVGELASAFQVAQPTMSSTVKRLEAKKLVDLAPDPHDRRIRRVKVTPAGAAVRRKAVKRLQPHFKAFAETAPGVDWQAILPQLTILRAYLEDRL